MVQTYSIYETKAHLSRLLKAVRSGKEIIVSDRGQPVAKIIPYQPTDSFEERWEQLLAAGEIIEAKEKPNFQLGETKKGALSRFLKDRE